MHRPPHGTNSPTLCDFAFLRFTSVGHLGLRPENQGVTLCRIVIGRLPIVVASLIAAMLLAGLHDLPVLTGDVHLVAMAPLHEDVVRVDFADDDAGDEPALVD